MVWLLVIVSAIGKRCSNPTMYVDAYPHCKCWELETEKNSSNDLFLYILEIIKIVQWMICPFQLRDCYFLEIFYIIRPIIYQQMDVKKLETNPKENQRF